MSSATASNGPPDRSPEPLWQLVQFKRMQAFNEENEDYKKRFECWAVTEAPPVDNDHCQNWIVVVLFNAGNFPMAKNTCLIRVEDQPGSAWWEATRIPNPTATISIGNETHSSFTTLRVKVPRTLNNDRQPPFTPLEITKDPKDGALKPLFSAVRMLRANLHLEIKSTPQLDDHIKGKAVPAASWKFHDPKHYHDIIRWGTDEEFEFEAESIRAFNRKSVYTCWLVLVHPTNDELPRPGLKGITRQQCLVIMAVPDIPEEFPRVGDLCDLAFARRMPALEKGADTTKDNKKLKRRGVKYLGGTRLDNPYEKFGLDSGSQYGSSWNGYCVFKVSVYKESTGDYSPLDDFACKLDWSTVSRQEGRQKPRVTLDKASAFHAHVWLDISTTTKNVELTALKKAMEQPLDSPVGKAFSYIRTLESPTERFNLFEVFPHMHADSQLPDNMRALLQRLDEDQKHVYRTVLANLPARVGIIPAGPGTGKTELMLTISALALSSQGGKPMPILLILEANRVATAAATRLVLHFEKLGRTDLRIVRAYNFNYEGIWGARRYLRADDSDDASPGFHFDECFQTHRPDHVPQLRKGRRGECLAPNLKEAAQLYLKEHLEDFPFISGLLSAEHPDEIQSDDNLTDENVKVEWDALFTRVLEETDFVITTPVGAAKIGPYFHPQLVIFDEAARARELGTLVALACFPTAEAWLFAGNVEMTKPYLASNGSKLWNPCADQLRTSLVARYLHAVPDTHRLSLNHQAYGNLHTLSSDLFWDGHIDSALPSDERFPPSTVHLLDYCRSLASNQKLTVPRLLVHVRSSEAVDMKQKSKFNKSHQHWVVNRILRDLAQDPEFRSTDGNEPGSILVTTPYKASFTNYRKSINGLLQELDREYRLAGSHGRRLHREVLIEARTADTCQGHAADVVVFDLVSPQITSHVADPNRLSSALTRAKQAEIIVMERGMLWREETANIRRGYRVTKSHIDELYEHCRSNGQVVIVDPVDDSQIKREYSLHRADAESVRDPSAVPRQLPVLPPSLDLPQDHEEAKASPAAAASDLSAPEGYGDDGDAESMFGLGGDVGYEMVRKAMELGLNLSADADGRR